MKSFILDTRHQTSKYENQINLIGKKVQNFLHRAKMQDTLLISEVDLQRQKIGHLNLMVSECIKNKEVLNKKKSDSLNWKPASKSTPCDVFIFPYEEKHLLKGLTTAPPRPTEEKKTAHPRKTDERNTAQPQQITTEERKAEAVTLSREILKNRYARLNELRSGHNQWVDEIVVKTNDAKTRGFNQM